MTRGQRGRLLIFLGSAFGVVGSGLWFFATKSYWVGAIVGVWLVIFEVARRMPLDAEGLDTSGHEQTSMTTADLIELRRSRY